VAAARIAWKLRVRARRYDRFGMTRLQAVTTRTDPGAEHAPERSETFVAVFGAPTS